MVQSILQTAHSWDTRVFNLIFGDSQGKPLKRFFFHLSHTADALSCLVVGLIWIWMWPGQWPYVLAALSAFALELSLYYLIKKNVRRPRPFHHLKGVQALIVPPDEFSFPSGHTGGAFLLAVILTAALPALAPFVFTWATLVGLSRVYLGVHYPGDVLAGLALGVISANVGIWFWQILLKTNL
jgi:undecaprenyl-diphosphatase